MSTRKAGDTSSDLPDSKRIRCISTQRTMSTRRDVRTYQPDEDAGAKLLHIRGPVLHILEYTMMEEEFETDLWKWLAQLRRVCQVFRDLTPELVPVKFCPTSKEMAMRAMLVCALMRSFPSAPWKTAKIRTLKLALAEGGRAPSLNLCARSWLETLGSLMNLEELELWTTYDGGVIDADFLYAIARNLPCLSHLHLRGYRDSRVGDLVTPNEFGTFAQQLQRPLQAIQLSNCEMTDAHLNAFFSHHGSSLIELNLAWNSSILNSALNTISQQCSKLVRLSLRGSRITSSGMEVILRANRGIRHLDVTHCKRLSSDFINIVVRYAPKLKSLNVEFCEWFTDECLDRLVQGQIDRLDRFDTQEIPLRTVDARNSGVSEEEIDRVKSKPNVSPLFVVKNEK